METKGTVYDKELENELINYIISKEIIINNDTDPYWDLLMNTYPAGLSKIEWSDNQLLLVKEQGINDDAWIDKIKEKLEHINNLYSLSDFVFIVIGDNLIDKGYKMKFSLFLDVYWSFFSIPQHTYVIAVEGTYCLNYTFEDELFFGSR